MELRNWKIWKKLCHFNVKDLKIDKNLLGRNIFLYVYNEGIAQ